MKMIAAGTEAVPIPYSQLLFNCNRNKNCQREYFVPIQAITDIMLYVDLPGEPDTMEINVVDACDPDTELAATAGAYVVGTKPDASWYGVFGSFTLPPNTLKRFFFKMAFLIDGTTYLFYSQQYEIPLCDPLKLIQACYPNEEVGVDAYDCNGLYYGKPNNPEEALGDITYRYLHSAYVRMGSIIEQRNKMQFTAFNNKTTYKSTFNREWLFEFEIVPTFYKDVLIATFNRGNIEVDGQAWKMAESQDFSMIDIDSQLWRVDVIFDEECKQVFGCASLNCSEPAPGECDDPPDTAVIEEGTLQTEAEGEVDHNGNPALVPNSASAVFVPNKLDFDDVPLAGTQGPGDPINGIKFATGTQTGGALPALPHNPVASRIRYNDTVTGVTTLAGTTLRMVAPISGGDYDVEIVAAGNLSATFDSFLDFSYSYLCGTTTTPTLTFTLSGGTYIAGQSIEWRTTSSLDDTTIQSGTLNFPALSGNLTPGLYDLEGSCYELHWRVICEDDTASEWQVQVFGNC